MPPTPRCRPPCAISPSASCPSTRRMIPIATCRTSRRCKWWSATRLRHTPRVSRCRSGCRASKAPCRPVAPWSTTSTRRRGRSKRRSSVPFASAYGQAFRDTLNRLDDLDAYELEDWFITPTEPLRETLQRALDQRRGKSSIALEEALDLVRAWFAFEAYRSFGGLVRPLLAEDKERRYVIEEVAIPVSTGRDDRGDVGPPAQRHRRRRRCRRCSSSRSIDRAGMRERPRPTATPACSRLRASRATRRFARARRSSRKATTRAPSSSGSQSSRGATAASACRASATAASSRGRRRSACRLR